MRVLMLKKLAIVVFCLTVGLGGGLTTLMAVSHCCSSGRPGSSSCRGSPPGSRVPGGTRPESNQDGAGSGDQERRCHRRPDATVLDLDRDRPRSGAGLWDDLTNTQQKVVRAASETEHTHRLDQRRRMSGGDRRHETVSKSPTPSNRNSSASEHSRTSLRFKLAMETSRGPAELPR